MEKIKNCPLCGGYVHFDNGPTYFREHILFCEGCNMYFALDSYNATEDDLIKAFNARTEEAVKADVDVDEWICGNCGHPLEHQQLLGTNVLFHEQYAYCPNCGKKAIYE